MGNMGTMKHVFRSTRVVTPAGVAPACVLVEDERIAAIDDWGDVAGEAVVHNLGDRVLLPGLVDTHVHINDPGRSDWEGFATATKAAASGGVTTVVDMPLNCIPETTSVQALEQKRAAARENAWVDWATWGGVVRGNADNLKPMMDAGVPGFKCFLIDSGVDGFQWVAEPDLRLALTRLQGSGLPLLAHAEAPAPVASATVAVTRANADWRKDAPYLSS